eukprot:3734242-Heterocapsa_arctica.AAC.1
MIHDKRPISFAKFASDVMVQGGAKPMTVYYLNGLTKDELFKNKRGKEIGEINIFTLPLMKKVYDVWPSPEVAEKMGANDAICQI